MTRSSDIAASVNCRQIFSCFIWVCLIPSLPFGLSSGERLQAAYGAELIAPLFVNNGEVRSVLVISNTGDVAVEILARFESLEGEESGYQKLHLEPRSSRRIAVDGVEMAVHRFMDVGSITLVADRVGTQGISAHIAFISRYDDQQILAEEAVGHLTGQLSSVRIARVAESVSVPVLAIRSLSAQPQLVSVDCSDSEGKAYQSQMTLPPKMTFLVSVCIRGRGEGRTYREILAGDYGEVKGPMDIRVNSGSLDHAIAVWGLAGLRVRERKPQIVAIEFKDK